MPQSRGNFPTVLVVFGATGDLAKERIYPALFELSKKRMLPSLFRIVGFSRRPMEDSEFKKFISEILTKKGTKPHIKELRAFLKTISYTQGFFDRQEGYKNLAAVLGYQDKERRTCANKLFYLAVPPNHYTKLFKLLKSSGLTIPCSPKEGWTRVVVEKPFGTNAVTAEKLDVLLGTSFREEQIYRIDHYLGKETVQNILAFRFSNSIFESAWNKDYISHIAVRAPETGDISERGLFYDEVGALRDFGQNHLLQLLALITMDAPKNFTPQEIQRNRAAVLKSLKIMNLAAVRKNTIRGQYKEYHISAGVRRHSQTETYFKIRAFLATDRWKGVSIELEHGKALDEKSTDVEVVFKHLSPCLCPGNGKHIQNILRYHIQPKEGITVSFWVKKPGTRMIVEEKDFGFDYRKAYPGEQFIDAHERLLLDVIEGNQTLFVSTEEIKASWRFIDPITKSWKENAVPLTIYTSGTDEIRTMPYHI